MKDTTGTGKTVQLVFILFYLSGPFDSRVFFDWLIII